MEGGTYRIVRFYADDRPERVIEEGVTLAEAQAHCNDKSTSGEDENGRYFDGYREEE